MAEKEKPSAPVKVPTRSVLDWQSAKSTPAWLFDSTRVRLHWQADPQMQPTEVTEAEYDTAVDVTANARL